MFYSFDLVIPANTAEASPLELEAEMTPGTIHHVAIQFPPGCRGLVHVRARHALHQLWPANPDGDLAADGFTVEWAEEWELDEEPFGLILEGWSPNTTFVHTITWRFALAETAGPGESPLLPPAAPPALSELVIP